MSIINNQETQTDTTGADLLKAMCSGLELRKKKYSVKWLWDKVIPEQSITLLTGRGGIGKTWISLNIAKAVSQGLPYLNLPTEKTPVYYIDFENPLPVLCERVDKLEINDVIFLHNSSRPRPPRTDSKEFEHYRKLPPGLIIFDTLRASHTGDENNSQQMSFVMNNLKDLRDSGFTIIVLHHTAKSNERTYKGSTAILDMADHCLGIYRVKNGTDNEIADDKSDDGEKSYRFGTVGKSRYKPFSLHVQFDPEQGFILAKDSETILMEKIRDHIMTMGMLKPKEAYNLIGESFGFTNIKTFFELLKKGKEKYWKISGTGHDGSFSAIRPPSMQDVAGEDEDVLEIYMKNMNL